MSIPRNLTHRSPGSLADDPGILNSDSENEYVIKPSKFHRTKAELMSQVVPSSLIPLATAQGMLIIGSHKTPGIDCKLMKVPEYLLFTGTISLGLVVMGVICRYLVSWILYDRVITPVEKRILKLMSGLSYVLVIVEVILLLAGAIVVFPNLSEWTYDDPTAKTYCEYGMVVFTTAYLCLAWSFILIGCICYVLIKVCGKPKKSGKQSSSRREEGPLPR